MIDQVLDLSHHNATPDFRDAFSGGLRAVILKATQGLTYTDPTYQARARPARDAGLMAGAYHFGVNADGVKQADYFLKQVQPDERTLLALDWETNPSGGTMTLAQAHAFVERIHQKTGRYPLLYSGSAFLKERLGRFYDPILSKCPLWLAQYGPRANVQASWKTWTLWQYTDHGIIERNAGSADRSRFNGDLDGLRELWGYPPLSEPTKAPH
jgi:lysozyme